MCIRGYVGTIATHYTQLTTVNGLYSVLWLVRSDALGKTAIHSFPREVRHTVCWWVPPLVDLEPTKEVAKELSEARWLERWVELMVSPRMVEHSPMRVREEPQQARLVCWKVSVLGYWMAP